MSDASLSQKLYDQTYIHSTSDFPNELTTSFHRKVTTHIERRSARPCQIKFNLGTIIKIFIQSLNRTNSIVMSFGLVAVAPLQAAKLSLVAATLSQAGTFCAVMKILLLDP